MDSSEWCSGGSRSLRMSLWPGFMAVGKACRLAPPLLLRRSRQRLSSPWAVCLQPLTLEGPFVLPSSALLFNGNCKCSRGNHGGERPQLMGLNDEIKVDIFSLMHSPVYSKSINNEFEGEKN